MVFVRYWITRLQGLLPIAGWLVVPLELLSWAFLRMGDEAIVPTLFSYGPRWIWLAPPIVLAPAVIWKRSLVVPLSLAFVICLMGPMQFEVTGSRNSNDCCRVTVLTLNAHDRVEKGSLRRMAEGSGAEILALQEWDEELTKSELAGWNVECAGGLCIASRHPLSHFEVLDRRSIGGYFAMAVSAQIAAPVARISFFSVHLETVRDGIEPILRSSGLGGAREMRANLLFRNLESRIVEEWIRERSQSPVIVAGDFNLPTDSAIYRRHWGDWSDAFEAAGLGFGYTKFTSWWGIRIDHVLFDRRWRAVACHVGPDIGSDHRPVMATLQRVD